MADRIGWQQMFVFKTSNVNIKPPKLHYRSTWKGKNKETISCSLIPFSKNSLFIYVHLLLQNMIVLIVSFMPYPNITSCKQYLDGKIVNVC